MTFNCKAGDTAQIVSGLKQNVGKVVQVVGPHPVARGYREPNGSIVNCCMWQITPPILGGDGKFYDCVADQDVRPFVALSGE